MQKKPVHPARIATANVEAAHNAVVVPAADFVALPFAVVEQIVVVFVVVDLHAVVWVVDMATFQPFAVGDERQKMGKPSLVDPALLVVLVPLHFMFSN